MTHDIVIRGGDIVDGTGAEPVRGDLAIDNSIITAVGEVDGKGNEEINAEDHVVSPGFIDLHTHLDAQIGWEPAMTPVSWHGISTALMGNCGVTFAPCKPTDRELLAGMMETVEDIPKHAIMTGLPWTWEGYGGYLDAIEELRPSLNVAGLVGHCAVRYYVMGERAVEEQATEDELKQMAKVVGESIDAGAVGFSTNRYEPHKLPDGRCIPGTFADPHELEVIGQEIGSRNALMQSVGADSSILHPIADATGSRMLFSYGGANGPGQGKEAAARLDGICTGGRDMTAITQVRGSGFTFGLQCNLPFHSETWDKLKLEDFDGRLAAINDTATYDKLVDEIKNQKSGAAWLQMNKCYFMGTGKVPDYTVANDQSLYDVAHAAGEHVIEAFLRITKETNGKGLWNFRMFNSHIDELGDLFKNPNIFPSLGDAGAHVSQIMDAGWASFVLSYWMREKELYTLGEGIRRLTSGPARVVGLTDRGTLQVGKRADVNVFDFNTVSELQPELVHDFPGGAPRFIQRAQGYKATIVNGQVNLRDDELTGARAGMVLRHGQAQ